MSLFGTDGLRARVGTPPITGDFIRTFGRALGRWLGPGAELLVGRDTRASGPQLEEALCHGLSAAGAQPVTVGVLPTPALSFLAARRGAAAAVISASHNPWHDNGIKLFNAAGEKLDAAAEATIEGQLGCAAAAAAGRARQWPQAAELYADHCRAALPMRLDGLRLGLDCANGACSALAAPMFRDLGAQVHAFADRPDGRNINADCGSTAPAALQALVVERGLDMGAAFDGDGDRVILVAADGTLLDGDEMLYVLAQEGRCAGVVGTLMSNHGLERALAGRGIGFARAPVGDRHVWQLMQKLGWNLGGEPSGHIIQRECGCTGDGMVTALRMAAQLVRAGVPLAQLCRGMGRVPQQQRTVPLACGAAWAPTPALEDAIAAADKALGAEGRVLVRPSGTEPLVRIMVEGPDASRVAELADTLASQVRAALPGGQAPSGTAAIS